MALICLWVPQGRKVALCWNKEFNYHALVFCSVEDLSPVHRSEQSMFTLYVAWEVQISGNSRRGKNFRLSHRRSAREGKLDLTPRLRPVVCSWFLLEKVSLRSSQLLLLCEACIAKIGT